MKCPNCGAEITGSSCEYCGTVFTDGREERKPACGRCGSRNLSFRRENQGEIRGRNESQVVFRTVGLCKDCGYTWYMDEPAPPRRRTWLWVLGWIFLFPVPLTVLLLRKKDMNPVLRYGLIALGWAVFLLIGRSSGSTQNEQPAETAAPVAVLAPTEQPAAAPAARLETPPAFETTRLYEDFFAPYVDRVGRLSEDGFRSTADLSGYRVDYTPGTEEDLCIYEIYADNGDYIFMMFYPINLDDPAEAWIQQLSLLAYESGEREISVSDSAHTYSTPRYGTHDPDRDPVNREVSTPEELARFLFG